MVFLTVPVRLMVINSTAAAALSPLSKKAILLKVCVCVCVFSDWQVSHPGLRLNPPCQPTPVSLTAVSNGLDAVLVPRVENRAACNGKVGSERWWVILCVWDRKKGTRESMCVYRKQSVCLCVVSLIGSSFSWRSSGVSETDGSWRDALLSNKSVVNKAALKEIG